MAESKRFAAIVGLVVVAVAIAFWAQRATRPSDKSGGGAKKESAVAPVEPSKPVAQTQAPESPVATPTEQPQQVTQQPELVKEKPKAVAKESEKPAEAVTPVTEVEDVVKALEFRQEWLPAGYALREYPPTDNMPNPGYLPEERLQEAAAKTARQAGVQIDIKRYYWCALKNETGNFANYSVMELADHEQALAAKRTWDSRPQASRRGTGTFVARNCFIWLDYTAGDEQVANPLLAKLKAAVNYKD